MSRQENAPLLAHEDSGLPPPNGVELGDHPIFLRAAHSPWPWLNQSVLCYIRGVVLTYLLVTGIMTLDFKTEGHNHSIWRLFFQFSTISGFLIFMYHFIVFFWTLTHLHWPDVEEGNDGVVNSIVKALSPPEQLPHSSKRFLFSLFYSVSHVWAFLNTLIYWAILVPKGYGHLPGEKKGQPEMAVDRPGVVGATGIDIGAEGWFKPFCLFNMFITPTLVALLEIFFLNSIRRQVPVPSHIFGLIFIGGLYVGWAAIGVILTGHDPFFWLNPEKVGSREVVAAYSVGFIALNPGLFSIMYGLIGMRESITERLGY